MSIIPQACLFDDAPTPAIYGIFCNANGRVYVGSAKNAFRRWKEHRNHLRTGTHHNPHLQAAWNKHGECNFDFRVLELVGSAEQLVPTEQKWIDKLRAADNRRGFNCCPVAGNTLGTRRTPEQKRNISLSLRGRKNPAACGMARGAKLTRQQVITIFHRLANGEQQVKLCLEYGVSRRTIGAIATRTSWKFIPFDEELIQAYKANQYKTSRGSDKGAAKLHETDVAHIKVLIAGGTKIKDIAAQYHIDPSVISCIKHGHLWKHVS